MLPAGGRQSPLPRSGIWLSRMPAPKTEGVARTAPVRTTAGLMLPALTSYRPVGPRRVAERTPGPSLCCVLGGAADARAHGPDPNSTRPRPGQRHPEKPISRAELRPGHRSLVDGDLVAQGEVLEGELAVAG